MLYSIPIALVVGLLLGGRLTGLAQVRFRWAPVILAGLVVQLILFSEAVTARIGDAGVPFYIASTSVVLLALAANHRITGVPIVVAGAACNVAAIVTNGGYMPASPGALEALGRTLGEEYSNSALIAEPALAPLTDVFAMPTWLPWANVFSVGDVLISVGVAVVIVAAMRRAGAGAATHIAGIGHPA